MDQSHRPAPRVVRIRDTSLRAPFVSTPGDVVSLAIGEPDFTTPEGITTAMKSALDAGHTHYAGALGLDELRAAIADRLGPSYGAGNVTITHGASGGLAAAIFALVDSGDEVVIDDPTYSLYADLIAAAGAKAVRIPRDPTGGLDKDRLAAALTSAALFIVCQPNNPTGRVLSADEWRFVAAATESSGTVVMSDEAYSGILHVEEFISVLDVEELRERALLCQTFSKTYAMTGWRLGYLAGATSIIADAALVHRTLNGPVATPTQHAALAAFEPAVQDDVARMVEQYRQRRDIMSQELSNIPQLTYQSPEGGFYFYCRYDDERTSAQIVAAALDQGVLVRSGREFGPAGEGHIRLSFAASTDAIVQGVRRLRPVFSH